METKDKSLWRQLIQRLPSSFNQTGTLTMDYENLRNIYFARKNHKLTEWHTVCHWIESLPYSFLITEPRLSAKEKHQAELISALSTDIKNAFLAMEGATPENAIKVLCNVQAVLAVAKNRLETPDLTAN